MSGIESFSQTTDALHHTRSAEAVDDNLTITYDLKTLAASVPLERAEELKKISDALTDETYYEYQLDGEGGQATDALSAEEYADLSALLLLLIFFGLAIWGARQANSDQAAHYNDGVFFPINISKFALLSVATLGFYALFWMYRCWRWQKQDESAEISPIGRTIFGAILFYALFDAVRACFVDDPARAQNQETLTPPTEDPALAPTAPPTSAAIQAPAQAIGVVLAALFFFWSVISNLLESLSKATGVDSFMLSLISAASFACVAPLVVYVNRLNLEMLRPRRITALGDCAAMSPLDSASRFGSCWRGRRSRQRLEAQWLARSRMASPRLDPPP